VMLLAANRRSTGIGVRPRGDRIEITADFTPDAPLMIATATLIVGIVREVMRWPSYEMSVLDDTDIPIIRGFHPMPHTTRKGWLARFDCYPENPFTCDIDGDRWPTTHGKFLTLREIAGRITKHFWPQIRRYSDPFTLRLIGSVMKGRAPSLLDTRTLGDCARGTISSPSASSRGRSTSACSSGRSPATSFTWMASGTRRPECAAGRA